MLWSSADFRHIGFSGTRPHLDHTVCHRHTSRDPFNERTSNCFFYFSISVCLVWQRTKLFNISRAYSTIICKFAGTGWAAPCFINVWNCPTLEVQFFTSRVKCPFKPRNLLDNLFVFALMFSSSVPLGPAQVLEQVQCSRFGPQSTSFCSMCKWCLD